MDSIDRAMKEAERLGFGVSYGKYQAARHAGRVEGVPSPARPKAPEKPSINCRHCGKPFIPGHANQVYCSPECRYAVKMAR